MPITAPAGPPITNRQAHAETRPEKTSKQDNNRQQSLNTLVILSSERFPVQLLKRHIKTRQPSPTISKHNSGVLPPRRDFQPFSREREASAD